MKIKYIINLLLHDKICFLRGMLRHIPWIVSDKTYVKIQYKAVLGKYPDIDNPKSFTEKLQWLKLYDHNPLYTRIVDKITAKEYIREKLGEDYIIPTLHVWDNPDEIDVDKLPDRFVLKCNHTGGGAVFICHDKAKFDFEKVKKKLKRQLKTSTFLATREWPYKNIERKVFCEKYMEDDSGELRDYKFYCFDGKVVMALVATNRFTNHNFTYVDLDFNPIDIESAFGKVSRSEIKKPECWDNMIDIAKKLSVGFPHVRVDLYNISGKIYFGELTFYDSSGFDDMNSEEWNNKLGDMIKLPAKKL